MTLMVRERGGRVRAVDEDGTGLPDSRADADPSASVETVDMLVEGIDRMEGAESGYESL